VQDGAVVLQQAGTLISRDPRSVDVHMPAHLSLKQSANLA
jgi:hypothetical protein